MANAAVISIFRAMSTQIQQLTQAVTQLQAARAASLLAMLSTAPAEMGTPSFPLNAAYRSQAMHPPHFLMIRISKNSATVNSLALTSVTEPKKVPLRFPCIKRMMMKMARMMVNAPTLILATGGSPVPELASSPVPILSEKDEDNGDPKSPHVLPPTLDPLAPPLVATATVQLLVSVHPFEGNMATDGSNTTPLADAQKIVSLKPDWSKGYSRLGAAHLSFADFDATRPTSSFLEAMVGLYNGFTIEHLVGTKIQIPKTITFFRFPDQIGIPSSLPPFSPQMEEALEMALAKDDKKRMAGVEHLHHFLESSRKTLSSTETDSLVDCCLDLLRGCNFKVSEGALLASAVLASGLRPFEHEVKKAAPLLLDSSQLSLSISN